MKNTSIKFRLITMISIFLLFFLVSFILSVTNMNQMIDNSETIYKIRLTGIQNLVEADRDAYQSNVAINHTLLTNNISKEEENKNIEDISTNLVQINERFTLFLNNYKKSSSTAYPDLERTYQEGYIELNKITNAIIDDIKTQNYDDATLKYFDEYMPTFETVRSVLDEFTNISSEEAKLEYDTITATSQRSKATFFIIFIIIMILAITGGYFLVRSITIPLAQGINFATEISQGNLEATIDDPGNNEIGHLTTALLVMAAKLKEVVSNIMEGASYVSSASEQINSSAQTMSQGANQQAASVEQISSTVEQMVSNIEQNTDNAQQTAQISSTAQTGIGEVSQHSHNTVDANKQISEKIDIINVIALQTNILALNAAVEAARAGEHGRGFAVVAGEVRKLAERSKVAAQEIVNLANSSLDLAQKAGDRMSEILPDIVKTADLVKEISAASIEQNNGASEINNAIQQLNGVTQQTASVSEELASSAEELNSQAEQLVDLVSFFKLNSTSSSLAV
nr:methyl-accepting chemotaxis protein [uncultured Carboxylicivirga sp.]